MFKKYNDTPAAIAMGLYLLGALVYGLQLIFASESWLTAHDIGPEGIPLARALGAAYLGFSLGVILTFVNSPDGQKTFFIALGPLNLFCLLSCGMPVSRGLGASCCKMLLPSLCLPPYCYSHI